ncbi:probable E3 ubiquitin-protein ligase HERC4 [Strongylocentrotus purpuratus]|uniref:HECT-type E3 ubiquitin transferase n=1 Tax=Strongylocentrotus purpuratus TaxID=7668 RepID=A0A7M7PA84_STRPU|nr:probable E3 ubiquitin-protein ligase HERC4 [Strongylocentrotus purpuratus]
MATNSKIVLESIFRLDPGADLTQKQQTDLSTMMSPKCLVEAFRDTDFIGLGDQYTALKMDSLKETFLLLKDNIKLLEQVAEVIFRHMRSELRKDAIEPDLLRVVPILLECPAFDRPDKEWGDRIIREMAEILTRMHKATKRNFEVLVCWWSKDSDLLARVVKVYVQAFRNDLKDYLDNTASKPCDNLYLDVLVLLRQINTSHGYTIPVNQFYILQPGNEELNRKIKRLILQLHHQHLQLPHLRLLSLANVPWVLDVPLKWEMLCMEFDSACQIDLEPFYLRFEIDDDKKKVVESAISELKGKDETSLMLPMEVHFKDNVSLGRNAGGPMKEFFSRLFGELFNVKKHSIFKKLNDSPSCTTLWFNKDSKDLDKLRSVGTLFALMFYNKVIVTMPFPFLFYKKLLGTSPSSLEDLKLLDPGMAKGMETLIEASDFELSDYRFTVDGPVNEPEIELKPGGKDEVVTTSNVGEYIELYARHYTASSQFNVFSESFRSMFGRLSLHKRFAPQELMSLFQGGEYDWKAFQESFGYDEKGYTANHRVVKMFWSVFHGDLTEDDKRDFLRVMTGADHVPIGGIQEVRPRMWPMGGDKDCKGKPPKDMCPEVNTCHGFVVLHLPKYRKREHLKERLMKLIEMKGHGFHKIPD